MTKSTPQPLQMTVRRRPGHSAQGLLSAGPLVFRCALGKGGVTSRKREGDGATPVGRMRVLGGFCRTDGIVARLSPLRLTAIRDDLGWCDASGDRNYNRPVDLPYPASHERMRRTDHLYDICLVLDWNIVPRNRNRGSAIFMHLARPGYLPTEGCIALAPRDMARLLPLLRAGSVIEVVR